MRPEGEARLADWMRRVVVEADGDVRVERVQWPGEPAAGQARVRPRLVGICGSDLHARAGTHPFIELPYRPGHEVVGVVEAVGAGVDGLAVNDRVVVEPNLVCGRCRQCRDGRYNICRELAVFGCQTAGGMAEAFLVAADRLHRLPDGMSDELGALVEPLATPVHAVRKADVGPGGRVAVLGAGPIGLLVLVAARVAGAEVVVVTDVLASKLDRARGLGADAVLDATDPGLLEDARAALGEGGADVVFDCVAARASMAQAVELVDKGGVVTVVGVPTGPTTVPLHLVQDREISVIGSLMYTGADMRRAIELLDTGVVAAHDLVTATFPLDGAAEAFAAGADPEQVKVLVRVGP
ncbi:MAG: alcohol dehydrogenase catalytic domain-containing protein [Pseudonocardia sp.]|nr:alcohol dehydrogenase catalytic domain-containing protein [Pseudonocardia sp.]MBO0872873.1 alcohol dehydrogenase catalytic domain-containing protein [Pseudonocardia sp.]